nr:hypothetical protein [Tanacetum cinerariifolium]
MQTDTVIYSGSVTKLLFVILYSSSIQLESYFTNQQASFWQRKSYTNAYIIVGNKMHKAFPLPRECSHWQYKFPLPVKVVPTAKRIEIPLPGVCTAIEEMMKKLPVKDRWQLH